MDSPQVRRGSSISVDVAQQGLLATWCFARVCQLGKCRQHDLLLAKTLRCALDGGGVDDF
jgi:hypothetical protein